MPTPNPATRHEHAGAAAVTTLSADITPTSTAFSIADPGGWSSGAVGSFYVVFAPGTPTEEKVRCSTRTGVTVNVDGGVAGRGVDGTTARDHAAGTQVFPVWTAAEADLLNEHAASSSGVHGAAGAVVGTTDPQTLSNKTLTTPTIGDLTNAQHDHSAAADGGGLVNPTIAGAALSGTFTGSPTLTGNPLFSNEVRLQRASAASDAMTADVTGDTVRRLFVRADGRLSWGPGNAALDTNLYRSAADTLKTDDSLEAAGLYVPGVTVRIATNTATADSSTFTTEVTVQSVTASLVTGRTYRVRHVARWGTDASPSSDLLVRLREDSVSGTEMQVGQLALTSTSSAGFGPLVLEAEFTAVSTGSKTFVATGQRNGATGNLRMDATATAPALLYVDYVRG